MNITDMLIAYGLLLNSYYTIYSNPTYYQKTQCLQLDYNECNVQLLHINPSFFADIEKLIAGDKHWNWMWSKIFSDVSSKCKADDGKFVLIRDLS